MVSSLLHKTNPHAFSVHWKLIHSLIDDTVLNYGVYSILEIESVLQNQWAFKFWLFPHGDCVEFWISEHIKINEQPVERSSPLNLDETN